MRAILRTVTAAAALGLAAGLVLAACAPPGARRATSVAVEPAAPVPEFASRGGALAVTLTAAESQVPYRGGTRWAMTYNGSATGPTLRVRSGDRLSITLVNDLDEPTSLHTHGLHVSPHGTGDNPFVIVEPGGSRTYEYVIPADHPAGTFWYHPHAHGMAASQVAAGLSGVLLVEDAVDDALDAVATDRVLVINDPPLTPENPGGGTGMGHMGGNGAGMMEQMLGRTGPRLLTNGQDGVSWTDGGGKLERARIVNATASSRLLLTWTGASMQRLAAEGGRLPSPVAGRSVELAPGERTELVLVPGSAGGQLLAQRLGNEGSGGPAGDPELIAQVAKGAGTDISALPASLAAAPRDLFAADVPVARQRVITLEGHMNPTIDGALFDPDRVDFEARQGTVEEWVIRNRTPMFHPIHLHAWPFQEQGQAGWQDVVQVPPMSERVIRVAFDDFGGTTVLHCHILDHEDTGMMAVIQVASSTS